MRVFHIIAIVFAFFFIIIMIAGTIGTYEERSKYSEFYSDEYATAAHVISTYIAVGISMVYFLFSFALYTFSVIFIKTTLSRVFAIIGLSLTLIMTIWGVIVVMNPNRISFDEVGIAWILYGLVTLSIAIIGTVRAFRWHRLNREHPASPFQPPLPNNWQQYPPQQPFHPNQPSQLPPSSPGYPPQQQPPNQPPWMR